jgi:hypothetical protein
MLNWLLQLIQEPPGKMCVAGAIALLIGGGLTGWSYLYRDPVTGKFVVWYGLIISGGVSFLVGILWLTKSNEPLA